MLDTLKGWRKFWIVGKSIWVEVRKWPNPSYLFNFPGELAIIYRDLLTLRILVQDGHKRMIGNSISKDNPVHLIWWFHLLQTLFRISSHLLNWITKNNVQVRFKFFMSITILKYTTKVLLNHQVHPVDFWCTLPLQINSSAKSNLFTCALNNIKQSLVEWWFLLFLAKTTCRIGFLLIWIVSTTQLP